MQMLPLFLAAAVQASPVVSVDATKTGRTIPNTSQVLTVWDGLAFDWTMPDHRDYPTRGFVRYVEMMSCTGGNAQRDLFRDPTNRTVLDDYDFTRLVRACRGVLSQGAKPYLKLGNVPVKFSADYDGGSFRMNIRPPTDHLVHYRYMKACAAALKEAFGRDEVRSWRYAVLTEADNVGWFRAKSKDKAEIREEFFKLYDYAAKAFEEELGGGLAFGTHLLYPGDFCISQFTIADVIAHCAAGTNVATGGVGAPLGLLTISYYGTPNRDDLKQGRLKGLREAIDRAHAAGFTNLVSGVDEGRVIESTPGKLRDDLITRAVGASYEAAFDLRVIRSILDAGADYFATWGWFSGPNLYEGLPSHHYFTCRELARFAGLRRAEATVSGVLPAHEELEALAGVSADGTDFRLAVGRFRDRLVFTNRLEATVSVRLPKAFADREVDVDVLTLDDRNNWFVDWERDRVVHGVTTNDYSWSPDDFAVLSGRSLVTERYRRLFAEKLQPAYARRAADVRPVRRHVRVGADGVLALSLDFVGNGAAFVSLRPAADAPRFVNVTPTFAEDPDFTLREIRRQRKEVGLREFMPSLSFHPQRTPAKALIPELCGRFRRLKEGLSKDDVVLGVLIQSLLGHGWNGKVPLTEETWTHVLKLSAAAEDPRYCLLDPGFRAYVLDCIASIARERPAFILLDDDFGIRAGECFCDRHVALFNRALGVDWTRNDYRRLYADETRDDPRILKVNAVLQRTMTDMSVEIRRTIDAVDPKMRCGLCACWPGYWQLDEIVHALAGPNTRPFMRLNGACYGDAKAGDLVHQFRGMRRVAAQLTGDVELWDEADTFPHNYMSESAAMFHAHLTQAMLMGLDGAKIWTSEFRRPLHTGSQARYEAYLRDYAGFYGKLHDIVAEGVRWQGTGAPVFRPRAVFGGHATRTAAGIYVDDWSTPLESVYGVPLRYDPVGTDGVFTLRREDVRAMTDGDLEKVLSGKAVVGGKAARLLCERGFGGLLGLKADAGDDAFHFKFENPADGSRLMACNWCAGMSRLSELAKDAEVTHWFCQGTRLDPKRAFPAAVSYRNAKGGTVVTLGWDFDLPYHYVFQPLRRLEFIEILDRLCGRPVEFVAETGDPTLVRHGLMKDGSELVTLNALTYEVQPSVSLRLLREPKGVECLSPSGHWTEVPCTRSSPTTVSVAHELRPLVPLVLRFRF